MIARTSLHKFFSSLALLLFLTLMPASSLEQVARADDPLDFTRDIRPILSNKCFHCHGPDGAQRQGGLRLDTKTGAFTETDSSLPAIIPGKPDESELYRRLISEDDSEQMPPADTGVKLTAKELETIKKWIKQGGKVAGHWSYEKPVRFDQPEVQHKNWAHNEIDGFVLAKLEAEGFTPQSPAPREALIRRLSLDLTGLPPSREHVAAFLADQSPKAYERVVDRLLASPTYGEHWARMWLDLSRYADSAGYADDPPRTIWAFRDYVIKSLNDNKPFDQFTIEQIAGDLLPNPTDEQLIATAFHRNTLTNNEGGTNDEEFRNAAIIDRVNTTFAVWMGTTMACAQCHTHKFDPISQKEFFQVFAILNNTEDADIKDERPLLQYYTAEQKQQKLDWEKALAQLNIQLKTPTPELIASQKKWEALMQTPLKWTHAIPQVATSTQKSVMEIRDNSTIFAAASKPNDSYEVRLSLPDEKRDAKTAQQFRAIQLETLPLESFPGKGAGNAGGGNFVITRVSAAIEPAGNRSPEVRYVRVEIPGKQKILSLAEVQVFSGANNIALQGEATQSSLGSGGHAKLANDNNTSGDYFEAKSTSHTATSENPWWEVDLKSTQAVNKIVIWNRTDNNLHTRLNNFRVVALDEARQVVWEKIVKESPNPNQEFQLSLSRPVELFKAFADFNQPEFDASFVLDAKDPNKRGWAVGGQIDQPHQLTLISKKPFQLQADEQLVVKIEQQSTHKDHTLGNFRTFN